MLGRENAVDVLSQKTGLVQKPLPFGTIFLLSRRGTLASRRMIHGEGLCPTRIQSENAGGNRFIESSEPSDDGNGAPPTTQSTR